jgi:uncharacterized protein (TIGR00369 family)
LRIKLTIKLIFPSVVSLTAEFIRHYNVSEFLLGFPAFLLQRSHNLMASDSPDSIPADSNRFDFAPISQLIGFQVDPPNADSPGECKVRLPVDSRLHNPMGRVHGGVLAALADASMGIAFGRTLDAEQDFSTIDLHIHFMRPVRGKGLVAHSTVRQRGLRVGFVTCDIQDDRGRLVASATCSCTVLDKI